MPPQGARRPDDATYHAVIGARSGARPRAAVAPNPGAPVLHRLNRAEYANAIRDVLASRRGRHLAAAARRFGVRLRQYLRRARRLAVAAGALSDGGQEDQRARGRRPEHRARQRHVPHPPGPVAGSAHRRLAARHDRRHAGAPHVPARRRVHLPGQALSHEPEHRARPRVPARGGVHGRRRAGSPGDDRRHARISRRCSRSRPTRATPSTRGCACACRSRRARTTSRSRSSRIRRSQEPVRLQRSVRSSADNFDWAGRPHMQTLAITGPVQRHRARRHAEPPPIFACRPARAPAGPRAGVRRSRSSRRSRAARIASPVEPPILQPVLSFYDAGPRAAASFETRHPDGARSASSPARSSCSASSAIPRTSAPGSAVPHQRRRAGVAPVVLPLEQRPRRRAAGGGAAGEAEGSGRRSSSRCGGCSPTRRRSALVDNFAGQWLQLRNVRSVQPNSDEFPDFDDNLRQAFQRETELFFESIMREDRNVLDLLRADYTFVNERLARHYGIPNVYGSHFRRVAVTDEAPRRAARAGQHSGGHVARRADVAGRARQVDPRQHSRHAAAAAASGRPALKENEEGQKPRTMREQMAEHRANPVCASCHKVMDPIGFALENFDAVGAWRTREPGGPIDASGELADGTKVDGVVTLRNALLSAARRVRRHDDREAADLRARARAGRARHARRPGDRPRRGAHATTGSRRSCSASSTACRFRCGWRGVGLTARGGRTE